jgi:hypothetical protein
MSVVARIYYFIFFTLPKRNWSQDLLQVEAVNKPYQWEINVCLHKKYCALFLGNYRALMNTFLAFSSIFYLLRT